MTTKLIAGNWKMNGSRAALSELAAMAEAAAGDLAGRVDCLVCPPATLLAEAVRIAGGRLAIGGQDCHSAASGAHTGDISAGMLRDTGASHVIVGHSERRADHGESNAAVRAKAAATAGAGLVAVVCVGETEAQRDEGRTLDILAGQLEGSLADAARAATVVVAYEPVWAIGTGRTPTAGDVALVHAFIRDTLVRRFGADEGARFRVLYGGSVKPSNAAELLAVPHVDGALVGGASLKAADFVAICRAAPGP